MGDEFPAYESIRAGNCYLEHSFSHLRKSALMDNATRIEQVVLEALRRQALVKDLRGVSITNVRAEPKQPFAVSFDVRSGSNRVQVLAEIKPGFSPRLLAEIAPWIKRLKSLRSEVAVAVIAPALSLQAQAFCIENEIDFLDLAGNISINVPGKFTLQRTGIKSRQAMASSPDRERSVNVFSGRS